MTHAIVLIEAERDAHGRRSAARSPTSTGVAEAYSVTGEWDFVGDRPRAASTSSSPTSSPGRSLTLAGVARTQTMVAFEVFSKHDLEAMFSIGDE